MLTPARPRGVTIRRTDFAARESAALLHRQSQAQPDEERAGDALRPASPAAGEASGTLEVVLARFWERRWLFYASLH